MAEPMQQQAERYLGAAIEPQEWRRACESAERKLQYIIDREGDANGERRKPYYLAQLIAEAVRSDRLRRLTAELADSYEITGTKKDSPCKAQGRLSTTPIVA